MKSVKMILEKIKDLWSELVNESDVKVRRNLCEKRKEL